jgi:hypothetical protein
MTEDLTCATVAPQLAEFAAGTLPADERGVVEAHVNVCANCRAEAESLVDVADALLLFAPTAEPPAGFDARVVDRMQPPSVRRLPRRRRLLLAAAAVIAVVAFGVGALALRSSPARTNQVQEIALRNETNKYVGAAYVKAGTPGWILVEMRYDKDTTLPVQLITSNGSATIAGTVNVQNGRGLLAFTSPVPVSDVRELRMLESDGTVVCYAAIHV